MQEISEGPTWMIRLATGEEVLDSLDRFARGHGVRAAAIGMGIGQLRSATIGFWTGQEYLAREIPDPTELVGLSGSLAEADGRPSVHVHVALAPRDYGVVGGHLLRGTVGLLAEILVQTFPSRAFSRPMDESLGLRTLRLEPEPGRSASGSAPPPRRR